ATAIGASVTAVVLGSQQVDLVISNQRDVFACRDVAALHQDVAVFAGTGGAEVDVAAGLQVTAMAGGAVLVAVALALAGADCDRDAKTSIFHIAICQGTDGIFAVVGRQCGGTRSQCLHAPIAGFTGRISQTGCRL